ncbi:ribosomal-protein-alanine N-acetyltransferase [Shimia isoporae]|uniref:Ribosomal-protein-alanine N-acetyltransferase n=1 Tax=Shimia isoporae TaxID=647720 RepID=A0A4R1NKH0_9RHOB|nr:GNAT family N-acetyltransferase [Shimia isoporae]TCL08575.1 ribosomal-protein-alanine N-acetyltransferase [Shimia isoporae]
MPDPAALAALHAAAFDTTRAWSAEEIASLLDSRLVFCIARPEGFILGRAVADESELLTLAIDPTARRMGHARALLRAFEDESRNRGAVRAILEVAEDNSAALALYETSGYHTTARRPGYYHRDDGAQIAASLMEKALN